MLLHFSVCQLGILLFNRMYNISVENYGFFEMLFVSCELFAKKFMF